MEGPRFADPSLTTEFNKIELSRYVFLHIVSAQICEILDSKLHAIVEGLIADRANKILAHA